MTVRRQSLQSPVTDGVYVLRTTGPLQHRSKTLTTMVRTKGEEFKRVRPIGKHMIKYASTFLAGAYFATQISMMLPSTGCDVVVTFPEAAWIGKDSKEGNNSANITSDSLENYSMMPQVLKQCVPFHEYGGNQKNRPKERPLYSTDNMKLSPLPSNPECLTVLKSTDDKGLQLLYHSICRHRFVWLSGAQYSGTSLLNYLSQQLPYTSGHTNTGAAMDEGEWMQTEYPPHNGYGDLCRFDPEENYTAFYLDKTKHTHKSRACIYDNWSAFWNLSQPVLLEKSVNSLLQLVMRDRLFPGVSGTIFCVRHPFYSCMIHQFIRKPKRLDKFQEAFSAERVREKLETWFGSHRYLQQVIKSGTVKRISPIMFEHFFAGEDPIADLDLEISSLFPELPTHGFFHRANAKNAAEADHRRLSIHHQKGSSVDNPKVDLKMLFGWTDYYEKATAALGKDFQSTVVPILLEYESQANEFGYSLLNLTKLDIVQFHAAFSYLG